MVSIPVVPQRAVDTSNADYASIMRALGTGVAGVPGDSAFQVSADSTGMVVHVAPGAALGLGFLASATSITNVTIAAAATSARVDHVVARIDLTGSGAAALDVKTGTPGSSAPATLSRDPAGLWEISLATVAVGASVVTIGPGDVTDTREWLDHAWTTATRPGTTLNPTPPTDKRLGLNLSTMAWEWWNGTAYVSLAPSALDASAITAGTLALARIPTMDAAHIPSLDASKITSGTLALAQIPGLDLSRIPTMDAAHIPSLDASIIGSGSVSVARGGTGASDAGTARTNLGVTLANLGGAPAPGTIGGRAVMDINGLNAMGLRWDSVRVVAKVDATEFQLAHMTDITALASGTGTARALAFGDLNTTRYTRGPDASAYARTVGSGYYAVYMDAGQEFGRNTSSRRYKEQIAPAAVDVAAVLGLEPVTFHRISDPDPDGRDLGLIAEDSTAVPYLVIHEPDPETGELRPEAIRYETVLPVALLAVVKAQAKQIAALSARLDALEARA